MTNRPGSYPRSASSSQKMGVVGKIFAGLLAATLLATGGVGVRGVKKRRDAENNTPDGKTLYETLEQQKLRTSLILGADGKTLATLGSGGGQYVALEHIKPEFLLTLIAQEDQRFREHDGFDWTAIFGILKYRLQTGERRGGSTIASQVFKIVENEENTEKIKSKRDKFWQRVDNNILEMVKAQKIINMNQDEMKWFLLEYYLNTTYFSPNGPGIQYAARYWFLKDQSELTIDEIAMILQAARNPSLYNPKSDNPKIVQNAEKGTDQTLKKLIDLIKDGSLHAAFTAKLGKNMPSVADVQHAKARRTLDKIKSGTSRVMEGSNQIPYASRQLIRDADGAVRAFMRATNNNLGLVDASGDTLSIAQGGGYEIKTTLRTTLQKSMTSLLATQGESLQKQRVAKGNAPETFHFGALVVDNETGAVLADVGGHDFEESELNVRIAPGQMGSVVKPIVLGCALELGIITSLDSTYIDQQYPLSAADYTGLDKDREGAKNYGEKRLHTAIPLGEGALVDSRNSSMMYVCTLAAQQGKAQALMDLLRSKLALFGIQVPEHLDQNPMLTIGLVDATLDQIVKMYLMLARGGNTVQKLYSIETIKGPQGMLAYNRAEEAAETPVQLFHPEIVGQLAKYLFQKGKIVTGQTNVLVKSGTAEDAQQLWLVTVTEKTTTILRVGGGKPSENFGDGINATRMLSETEKAILVMLSQEKLYDAKKALLIGTTESDTLELILLPKTDSLQVQEPVELERE